MPAPTIAASNSAASASNTNHIAVTRPIGTLTGDLVVGLGGSMSQGSSGGNTWSASGSLSLTLGGYIANSGLRSEAVFSKVAGGSEPGTYTLTCTGGSSFAPFTLGVILDIQGSAGVIAANGHNTNTLTAPTISTTSPQSLVVLAVVVQQNTGTTVNTPSGGWSFVISAPANTNEDVLYVFAIDVASIGSVGGFAITTTGPVLNPSSTIMVMMAFSPGVATPTTPTGLSESGLAWTYNTMAW